MTFMAYHTSFQDILYVLAGIAWVAYSAYRANKKREKAKKDVPEKSYSVFDALFDEDLPLDSEIEIQKKTENITPLATPFVDNASMINNGNSFLEGNGNSDASHSKWETEMESIGEEEAKEQAKQAYVQKKQVVRRIEFDLKKAFIYSEILNRKYS